MQHRLEGQEGGFLESRVDPERKGVQRGVCMRLILGDRHCSGYRDSGPVALVGEDPREGSIDCGSEGRTAADIDYGSGGQRAADIDFDSEGRKAVGIGFAEADREAADNGHGWAVGR